jgi:hypothetical protein
MRDPKYLQNIRRYGPRLRDEAATLDQAAALANARSPSADAREMNMRAIAGNAAARKQNAQLQQELQELGDQYKREARGMEAPEEDSIISRVKSAAGMKKGGKVSSASKRADGIAQRGKTRGRMV